MDEAIKEKFSGIYARMAANNDIQNLQHSQILEKLDLIHSETKKTNGRVTKLEKEISIVRFFSSHPKLTIFIFVLLLSLLYNKPIYELIINILN